MDFEPVERMIQRLEAENARLLTALQGTIKQVENEREKKEAAVAENAQLKEDLEEKMDEVAFLKQKRKEAEEHAVELEALLKNAPCESCREHSKKNYSGPGTVHPVCVLMLEQEARLTLAEGHVAELEEENRNLGLALSDKQFEYAANTLAAESDKHNWDRLTARLAQAEELLEKVFTEVCPWYGELAAFIHPEKDKRT